VTSSMLAILMFWRSQSYSCWYWVLSDFISFLEEKNKRSQSYSCWYWVLSRINNLEQMRISQVSILFLLVLGSVELSKLLIQESMMGLNPILAGTGFCLEV